MSDLAFVRRVRRAIHRRPELGHREWATAALIERILDRLGLCYFRPAPTSVATVVGRTDRPPDIGFRADMDALPIRETTATPYSSRNEGVMHACGHDGHVATLLGLARRLVAEPDASRTTLLVFQQAEEGYPSGAPRVVRALPARLRPREFVGFHLWPELPAGVVGLRRGALLASVAGVTVTISGTPGRAHGTRADANGVDALAVGVQVYTALTSRWADRTLDDHQPSTVSVGFIAGGQEPPGRVPERCVLRGTLRALSWADQAEAVDRLREVTANIASASGASIEVDVESGIRPPVRNSSTTLDRIDAACRTAGITCRPYPEHPIAVSDDFGWYLQDHPGAMFLLGCAGDRHHPDLHTPGFDFDESALLTAVDLLLELTKPGRADEGR